MEKLNKKITVNWIIQLVLFAVLIIADRLTKAIAVNCLKGNGEVPVIGQLIVFRYLENSGAAFGIFQNQQWLFYIITALVLIALAVLWILIIRKLRAYLKLDGEKFLIKTYNSMIFLNYIFAALAAGAVGNLIDRLTTTYVVDFIYFKFIDFPIFNFADICVTISAALLVIFFIFVYKEDPNFSIWGSSKKTEE